MPQLNSSYMLQSNNLPLNNSMSNNLMLENLIKNNYNFENIPQNNSMYNHYNINNFPLENLSQNNLSSQNISSTYFTPNNLIKNNIPPKTQSKNVVKSKDILPKDSAPETSQPNTLETKNISQKSSQTKNPAPTASPYFICNSNTNEYGYSQNYYCRIDITSEIKEKLKNKYNFSQEINDYIFVANQTTREKMLSFSDVSNINYNEYSFLELISRTKHKGISQEELVNYHLDPVKSHYYINRMIKKRHIVKLKYLGYIPEIPNNLLLLMHFYDVNKIHAIYTISKLTLDLIPYNFYISKLFDIIINSSGSIRNIFNIFFKFYDINILEFKNCLYYLYKASCLSVFKNGEKFSLTSQGKLFPFRVKFLADDKIELYTDLWLQDIDHENWDLILCREDPDILITDALDVSKKSTSKKERGKILYNIPYERSIILYINDLVIKYTPKGITINEIKEKTGLSSSFIRTIIHHLEKKNIIKSQAIQEENRRFKKYFSTILYNLNILKPVDDLIENKTDSIDLTEFIKNISPRMPTKIKRLKKNYIQEKINFIISYFKQNSLCVHRLEQILMKLNEWEKTKHEKVSSEIMFNQLITDMILMKIIRNLKLRIKNNDKKYFFSYYVIWTDNLKVEYSAIAECLKKELIRIQIPERFLQTSNLIHRIKENIYTRRCMTFKDDEIIDNYAILQSWEEKQFEFLKLINSYYIKPRAALPKFFKLKMLHLFLTKLLFNLDWKDENNIPSCSDPFMGYNWLTSIKSFSKPKFWFSQQETLFEFPLILFICLVTSNLNKERNIHFINMKSKYLLPIKNIIKNDELDKDLFLDKYFTYLTYLYSMRLIARTKESLKLSNHKITFNLMAKTSIFNNINEITEEKEYEFKYIDDVIAFWCDLENLANTSSIEIIKQDKINILSSIRKYLTDYKSSNKNEPIIMEKYPKYPLGYPKHIYISSNYHWKFKKMLYPVNPISIIKNSYKRKTSVLEKKSKKYINILNVKIYFSSTVEEFFLCSYIIWRLKYDNIKQFCRYFKSDWNKCSNLVYSQKKVNRYFTQITYNTDLFRFCKHIIKHLNQEKINLVQYSMNNSLNEQLEQLRNQIKKCSLLDKTLNFIINHFTITHLFERKKYNFDILSNSTEPTTIFQRILMVYILNKCFEVEIPLSAVEKLYEVTDYNFAIQSFKCFYNRRIFSKFPRIDIQELYVLDTLENFIQVYKNYMNNITIGIKQIFNEITKKTPNIPLKINNEIFIYMIENYINSNIDVICRLIDPQQEISFNLNKIEDSIFFTEDQTKIFYPEYIEINFTRNLEKYPKSSSRQFYIDVIYQLIIQKFMSRCPKMKFTNDILDSIIMNLDLIQPNADKNVKIFSQMMTHLGLSYDDTNDIYQDIIQLKNLKESTSYSNIIRKNKTPENNLFLEFMDELPKHFTTNLKSFCEYYILKIIEKHPGITQIDIYQKCHKVICKEDFLISIKLLVDEKKITELMVPQRKRIFFPSDEFTLCYIPNILF